jgi:phosphomevalonate kinase
MQRLIATAPGKVVLAGEYAVLDGAPAICMAVDRRARVTVTESEADWHSVLAPGFAEVEGRFLAGEDDFEWLADGAAYALVEHVWRTAGVDLGRYKRFSLDTSAFVALHSGRKLGIGSSAALTVAFAAALCEMAGRPDDVGDIAQRAHRQMQGGSGVDVACSLQGGVIEYRMSRARHLQLEWPAGLMFAVLWSGVVADTRDKLGRLGMPGAKPSRADLGTAATRVASAWRGGSAAAVLNEMRAYTAALRRFDVDHGLGIFDAGHLHLTVEAETGDVVYKPCGAGGGDIGIVFATDETALRRFVGQARATAFSSLDLAIEPQGVRLLRP